MNHKLLVSIIIPVYNVEQYLYRCLQSVGEQTYKNLEIILVDDGSTDSSGMICEEFALLDIRVQVFHKLNGGVSSARNLGLLNATGDYVVFVDADDYVDVNFVEELVSLLTKGVQFAACSYCFVGKEKKNHENERVKFLTGEEAIINMLLAQDLDTSVCCKIFPAKVAKSVLFNTDLIIAEDVDFYYRILRNFDKVAYKDVKTYHYDTTKPGTINSFSKEKVSSLKVFDALIAHESDNRIAEALTSKYISTCFHFLYLLRKDMQSDSASELKATILKYRKVVIFGKFIKKKVRGAALLSIVSFKLVNFLMAVAKIV